MSGEFQVLGTNASAPFTLKLHRGDGMTLLGMNWRDGRPPPDFVGFAVEYKEPGGDRFFAVKNRIAFPGVRTDPDVPSVSTRLAPLQKFRWAHFPWFAGKEGAFLYRVTPVFMNAKKELSYGEFQDVAIELRRETHPGKLNIAYTRGFVSSQAFVDKFQADGKITTIIPSTAGKGLTFKPSHPRAAAALEWMGFEARQAIFALLDEAIDRKAEVRAICFDLNMPEIVDRLEKLGSRLKIIIDDSDEHSKAGAAENAAEKALRDSAGADNVKRMHMSSLQHHKSIAVRAEGLTKVLYGSTNFSWRGFYVQSNNAVIASSASAAGDYFSVFEDYWESDGESKVFGATKGPSSWLSLGLDGVDAAVTFSPHGAGNAVLQSIADDIDTVKDGSVFFSLAFLGQTTKGPIVKAIGRAIEDPAVFCLGIADKPVKAENLGVEVVSPDGKRKTVSSEELSKSVPMPFKAEPSGGTGARMHHKFVVLDFNTDNARVYTGSYNFSEPADRSNGENLLLIKDRRVATSYMIEALRIYDHYRFRIAQSAETKKGKSIALKEAPVKASEKAWWEPYWTDAIKEKDRLLFS